MDLDWLVTARSTATTSSQNANPNAKQPHNSSSGAASTIMFISNIPEDVLQQELATPLEGNNVQQVGILSLATLSS